MSHQLEFLANGQASMAYANDVPWHGLGVPVSDGLTPLQIGEKAGILWKVSKDPIYHKVGAGRFRQVPDQFALVRDRDQKPLSIVGNVYKPVQNEQALEFFDAFVKAGDMKMETVGSLAGGKYVWSLAKFAKDFTLGKDDEVASYLLLASPHVAGKSLLIQTTPIRVVCRNTLTMAVGEGLKGGQHAFRMPHSREFGKDMQEQAKVAVGLASAQIEQFKEAATLLASKRAKADEVEDYFFKVLHFVPGADEDGKKRKEPRALPKLRSALLNAPGQGLATADGTWWGALNAVTNVIDHGSGRERDTALASAWFGQKAGTKRFALDLALQKAA